MKREKQTVLTSVSVLVVLVLASQALALNFGISPPRIINDAALPGSVIKDSITLSKIGPEGYNIITQAEGEAAEWIDYPKTVEFKRDITEVKVPITITVPSNALQEKTYTAKIDFKVDISEQANAQQKVYIAIPLEIEVSVTDKKIKDYIIRDIKAEAKKEQEIALSYTVYNKGNIPSGPERVTVEVLDNLRRYTLHKAIMTSEKVPAFSAEKREVTFSNALEKGYYWLNVTYTGNQQQTEDFVFLELTESTVGTQTKKGEKQNNNLPTIITLLLLFGIILLDKRKEIFKKL